MVEGKKMEKLPGGWIKVKLRDISQKLKAGGTPSRDIGEFWDGDIPFVLIDDITRANKYLFSTNKTISKKGLKNSSAWLVPENSILLSMYASLGEVVINKIEVATNQAILAIIPKKEVDLEFEYYLLKFNKKSFEKFITQTTQMNLNKEIISNVVFEFPSSLVEQRKIAEILETVDNSIEKTDKIIEKHKRIKQGLMQVLLTRGIVESDELGVMSYESKSGESDELGVRSYESKNKSDELGIKSYEFEGKRWEIRDEKKHKFKDSPLGRIPEEWEVVELGDVATITMGQSPDSSLINKDSSGIPFLQGNAEFTKKYPDPNNWIEKALKLSSVGSVLISVRAPVGDLNISDRVYCIGRGLAAINVFDAVVEYVWYVLHWSKDKLVNKGQGSTFEAIGKEDIMRFEISLPPLLEQQRIASILSQIDEVIEKEQKYKAKLERIKQGLMEDLLTGKVRVGVE